MHQTSFVNCCRVNFVLLSLLWVRSVSFGGHENRQANQRSTSTYNKKNMATDDDILEIRMFPTYVEPQYNLVRKNPIAVSCYITFQSVLIY